jgi:hypothetical protein
MDEKEFKQHLRDLVHGHHHPEEHDWSGGAAAPKTDPSEHARHSKNATKTVRKRKPSHRASR